MFENIHAETLKRHFSLGEVSRGQWDPWPCLGLVGQTGTGPDYGAAVAASPVGGLSDGWMPCESLAYVTTATENSGAANYHMACAHDRPTAS